MPFTHPVRAKDIQLLPRMCSYLEQHFADFADADAVLILSIGEAATVYR
jgi:hypothetical protein